MTQPKLPSPASIKRVLDNAYSSPQPNCQVAQETLAAIIEVDNYFKALTAPADVQPEIDMPPGHPV